jgi:hypothetical protein
MGLLGEACSVRDSHRRAALDTTFAAEHPIKPAREGKDPTERLRPKEPRKTKGAHAAPVDAPVSLPDVPVTAPALQRMADEVNAEADALASVRDVPWVWQESSAKDDAVAWFTQVGLDDLAEEVSGYDGGPDRPLDTFIGRTPRAGGRTLDVDEPTRPGRARADRPPARRVEDGARAAGARAAAGPLRRAHERVRAVPRRRPARRRSTPSSAPCAPTPRRATPSVAASPSTACASCGASPSGSRSPLRRPRRRAPPGR